MIDHQQDGPQIDCNPESQFKTKKDHITTQHTNHNTRQDTKHNTTQHNTTQLNTTQHNRLYPMK